MSSLNKRNKLTRACRHREKNTYCANLNLIDTVIISECHSVTIYHYINSKVILYIFLTHGTVTDGIELYINLFFVGIHEGVPHPKVPGACFKTVPSSARPE